MLGLMKCGLSELDYYCVGVVAGGEGRAEWHKGLKMHNEQHGKGIRKGYRSKSPEST
jgi:hypothetical protein